MTIQNSKNSMFDLGIRQSDQTLWFIHTQNFDWQQNWTKMKRSKKKNRLNFHCHLTIEMSFIRTFGFWFIKYTYAWLWSTIFDIYSNESSFNEKNDWKHVCMPPTKLMDFASINYELFGCRTGQPILFSLFFFRRFNILIEKRFFVCWL